MEIEKQKVFIVIRYYQENMGTPDYYEMREIKKIFAFEHMAQMWIDKQRNDYHNDPTAYPRNVMTDECFELWEKGDHWDIEYTDKYHGYLCKDHFYYIVREVEGS